MKFRLTTKFTSRGMIFRLLAVLTFALGLFLVRNWQAQSELVPSHFLVHLPNECQTCKSVQKSDGDSETAQSIYLEYRRNLPPFDIFQSGEFPNPPLQLADKGVTIRLAGTNNPLALSRYYIIDTTPLTNDFGDAALPPSGTYTNTYYGVSITTISVNPFFGARVKIQLTR